MFSPLFLSIHDRHSSTKEAKPRFIKIQRSPSVDDEMLKDYSSIIKLQPPPYPRPFHQQSHQRQSLADQQSNRTNVGTTVASYLETFHPEHYYHQPLTPQNFSNNSNNNGIVSKQRIFFSQQLATPIISVDLSSSSQEEESEIHSNNSKVSEIKNDYLEKISTKFNNRRKSAPHTSESTPPKVTITGVTAIDPPELPTSFYLLRQSQESLVLKRQPRTISENPSERDRSPSYRTIIKFSKNREIIPDSDENYRTFPPIPHSELKPGESNIRSTPSVEVSVLKFIIIN
uniref:Uncharacterized protein n=1 Tax=Panagrolaimus superbus TaxID=310955 RepID=A0A914YZ96_9BILA